MTREQALAVLGLGTSPTRDEVEQAYRELAQMLHPDKYDSSPRMRERAERQMAQLNDARRVLLDDDPAAPRRRRAQTSPAAKASAAETARLVVVQNMRTLSGVRRNARIMLIVGLVGILVAARLRGTARALGFSICLWLAVWGAVDMIRAGRDLSLLRKRERELAAERDAARSEV